MCDHVLRQARANKKHPPGPGAGFEKGHILEVAGSTNVEDLTRVAPPVDPWSSRWMLTGRFFWRNDLMGSKSKSEFAIEMIAEMHSNA